LQTDSLNGAGTNAIKAVTMKDEYCLKILTLSISRFRLKYIKEGPFTKKLPLLLVFVLLMTFLSSCADQERGYEIFRKLGGGSKLQRDSTVYSFYGPLHDYSLIGRQIGVVDGDKKHKVFEVKGYSTDEWIIEYYDVIMSVYNLYKSDTVTEIPNELKQ